MILPEFPAISATAYGRKVAKGGSGKIDAESPVDSQKTCQAGENCCMPGVETLRILLTRAALESLRPFHSTAGRRILEVANPHVKGDAMANEQDTGTRTAAPQGWESRVREAAGHVETDLRKLIDFVNDEVMPDVRRNGSSALRSAAAEFEKLAMRMDQSNRGAPPPSEPKR